MKLAQKFDTVDELEQAYTELQSAFTRKCQELSELREKMHPTEAEKTAAEVSHGQDIPCATVPKTGADIEREACIAFFAAHPKAKEHADALCRHVAASNAVTVDECVLLNAYIGVLNDVIASFAPDKLAADEQFLTAYVYPSSAVRAYFEKLLAPDMTPAPRLIKAHGATILPPVRPTNLIEAGALAQEYFKENKQW